jgi:A/G-specific adenine glycosylase
VAEVLLQRSRGKTVAKVYEQVFARWPEAESLSRARESSIADVIRPLGLVRRAAVLRAMAKEVVRRGGVPSTQSELLELPGVGPYAAGATAAVAFSARTHVVDGVTARVYRRYFGLDGEGPASNDRELWDVVEEATPPRAIRDWNWAVLDLAATVCLPRRPACGGCPLQGECSFSVSVLGSR